MKVNGYVYRADGGGAHFDLSITDVKLVTLLHSSLIVSAKKRVCP